MSTTTTEPIVTHPSWCNLDDCETQRGVGQDGPYHHAYHHSPTVSYDAGGLEARIELFRFDSLFADVASEPSVVNVRYISGSDSYDPTPDELEAFGRWLIERATEYRQAIATEDGDTQ